MNPILRRVLAVMAGVVTSGLVVMAVESLGHKLFTGGAPMPKASDTQAVASYMNNLPLGVLLSLLVAWCGGAYFGTVVAIKMAGGSEKLMSLIVGVFMLLTTAMNFFQFPHPLWLMIGAIILIPVCAWLAIPGRSRVNA